MLNSSRFSLEIKVRAGLHQLQQRKLRIQAALREQFVVGALRDDVAVLDDDDAVGLLISNTGHLKHGTV